MVCSAAWPVSLSAEGEGYDSWRRYKTDCQRQRPSKEKSKKSHRVSYIVSSCNEEFCGQWRTCWIIIPMATSLYDYLLVYNTPTYHPGPPILIPCSNHSSRDSKFGRMAHQVWWLTWHWQHKVNSSYTQLSVQLPEAKPFHTRHIHALSVDRGLWNSAEWLAATVMWPSFRQHGYSRWALSWIWPIEDCGN